MRTIELDYVFWSEQSTIINPTQLTLLINRLLLGKMDQKVGLDNILLERLDHNSHCWKYTGKI